VGQGDHKILRAHPREAGQRSQGTIRSSGYTPGKWRYRDLVAATAPAFVARAPVQYCTAHYSTVQYSTVQYTKVLYSTLQPSTVQYITLQYSTVQ